MRVIDNKGLTIAAGLALLSLVTAGCGVVGATHAVGGEPANMASAGFEGSWLGDDGPITIRAVDAERGLFQAAWIEEGGQAFSLEAINVEVRASGDWLFANFELEEKDREGAERYVWMKLVNEKERLLLWWPDEKKFRSLVQAGVLPGTVDGDSVTLSRLEAAQLELIMSEEQGVLFSWSEPMVLTRLPS